MLLFYPVKNSTCPKSGSQVVFYHTKLVGQQSQIDGYTFFLSFLDYFKHTAVPGSAHWSLKVITYKTESNKRVTHTGDTVRDTERDRGSGQVSGPLCSNR